MKISIYSSKGSAGKTPIATNIALDKDFCIGTNELFHVYDGFIPDNQLIALDTEDEFPDVGNIDIVFDLAGSISKSAHSITSALKMSDYVIVPIYNEFKCLVAGLNTISQILEYNNNIIVVATKLQKTNDFLYSKILSNTLENLSGITGISLDIFSDTARLIFL
jgi:MinD-like ATPase involved in chromosome partitioning or flagellar assembly